MRINQAYALIALVAVSVAHADDYINHADVNGDGFVSLHELRAAYFADPEFNKKIEQSFSRYDLNGDGMIDAYERPATTAMAPSAIKPVAPSTAASAPEKSPVSGGTIKNTTTTANARPSGSAAVAASAPARVSTESETNQSRTKAWLLELDSDNSGGASSPELLANGGGQHWFSKKEFAAADANKDGELNATELAALIQSLERRQR